jgi:hypothetical protein
MIMPPSGPFTEDRRQHLDFIQAALARMATASSVAKGWSLTVCSAALGYALVHRSWPVSNLAVGAVVLFGLLDLRYLREERKFRALYEAARQDRVDVYDMRTNRFVEKGGTDWNDSCSWPASIFSWSIWLFYGPLLAASLLVSVRLRVWG